MSRKKDYQRESHRCNSEQGGFIMTNQIMSINMEVLSIPHEEDICWVRCYNLLKKALCGWKEDREPRDTLWARGMDN